MLTLAPLFWVILVATAGFTCKCGNDYSFKRGLTRHQQKCGGVEVVNFTDSVPTRKSSRGWKPSVHRKILLFEIWSRKHIMTQATTTSTQGDKKTVCVRERDRHTDYDSLHASVKYDRHAFGSLQLAESVSADRLDQLTRGSCNMNFFPHVLTLSRNIFFMYRETEKTSERQ